MLQVLQFSFYAVFPILALLFLGYVLARKRFLSEAFLKNGNDLVFRLLLPMTIFHNIYVVPDINAFNWTLILFALAVIFVLFLIGCVASKYLIQEQNAKGVFIQYTFRSNFAIIGLPLAESLGGVSGAAVASILSAFAGIMCLLLRTLMQNLGSGEVFFSLQNDMPFLFKVITWLHQSSGPLALLVMGGLLDFRKTKGKLKNLAYGTVFRLVVAPLIGLAATYLGCRLGWFSCGAGEYGALIALFGSPVAVSSAIMASSMGGDDELARQYVVWTAAFSMITLFFISAILRVLGFI